VLKGKDLRGCGPQGMAVEDGYIETYVQI